MGKCLYIVKDRSFCAVCPDLMSAACPSIGFDCNLCKVDCLCKIEATPERTAAYEKWLGDVGHSKTMANRRLLPNRARNYRHKLDRKCRVCGSPIEDNNKSGGCRLHVRG